MKTGNLHLIACIFAFVFTACPHPCEPPYKPPTYLEGCVLWKGESKHPPVNMRPGWAYYNTVAREVHFWKTWHEWKILPDDCYLTWKGEGESPPNSPKLNWAYYRSTDKKTYIWDGNEWQALVKNSLIGPKGIVSAEIPMAWIPAGSFQMGSHVAEPERKSDETQHHVTLSKGFYMGKYEVTQEQFFAVTRQNPSRFNEDTKIDTATGKLKGNRPVERVSWYEAIEFCNMLSIKEWLSPAYSLNGKTDPDEWELAGPVWEAEWDDVEMLGNANGYRLPTEVEWEYACRAGTDTAFNWGTGQITTAQANYNGKEYLYNNSPKGKYREKTTAAGSFAPNAWGLYDMHGNVAEWCWDWYGEGYYENSPAQDPTGPSTGIRRILRGGSFYHFGGDIRSAVRTYDHPYAFFIFAHYIGFRVVRSE